MGHTGQCADHGESSEGASEPLSAHDGRGVRGRQNPCQPKQTALKNRPKRWGGNTKQDEDVKEFLNLKSCVKQKKHPTATDTQQVLWVMKKQYICIMLLESVSSLLACESNYFSWTSLSTIFLSFLFISLYTKFWPISFFRQTCITPMDYNPLSSQVRS